MTESKRSGAAAIAAMLVLLCLLGLASIGAAPLPGGKKKQEKGPVVYVCACLKNRSCSCMTEAKTEGPCSCGTSGGPPLKAVPANSSWAKANRRALAQRD
jgi:hypothetical protein